MEFILRATGSEDFKWQIEIAAFFVHYLDWPPRKREKKKTKRKN